MKRLENRLLLCDCREAMKREDVRPDYIYAGIPDFNELGMDPEKDNKRYWSFISECIELMTKICDVITIAMLDRKAHGRIFPKNAVVTKIFEGRGFYPVIHKIMDRSTEYPKINLYRLMFSHAVTYVNDIKKVKRNYNEEFNRDVLEYNFKTKFLGFNNATSYELVRNHILELTEEDDLVYNPFMGTGTIAEVAIETGRKFLGSEIDKDTYTKSKMRIGYFE